MYVNVCDRWMFPCHHVWPDERLLAYMQHLCDHHDQWQIGNVDVIQVHGLRILMAVRRLFRRADGELEGRSCTWSEALGYEIDATYFVKDVATTASAPVWTWRPTEIATYFLGDGCAHLPRHAFQEELAIMRRWEKDVARVWKILCLPARP